MTTNRHPLARLRLDRLEDRIAPAARVWDGGGGDGRWATAANWEGDVAPAAGDTPVFGAAATGTLTNDLPADVVLGGLTVSTPGLTIAGAPLRLAGDIELTYTAGVTTVQPGVVLTADAALDADPPGAWVTFEGPVDTAGHTLTVRSSGRTTFAGGLASDPTTGGLVAAGRGTVLLTADSPGFRAPVTVASGVATLTRPLALGSPDAGTTVQPEGTVEVGGGVTVSEPLTLSGTGVGGEGSLLFVDAGNTWAGAVVIAADAAVGVATGTSTIAGSVDGDGRLLKRGPGALRLAAANPLRGATAVENGVLQVDGSSPASALTVAAAGTVQGTGTVGAASVDTGAVTAGDGSQPGILRTGAFTQSGGRFSALIAGRSPGAEYSQLSVSGPVELRDPVLDIRVTASLSPGEVFVLIANDGDDPVTGQFQGLGEGATVVADGRRFRISYRGGDGNDVTAIAAPSSVLGNEFVIGSGPGGTGQVRVFRPDGSLALTATPFGPQAPGGVRAAAADLTGDGVPEVIAGTGPGAPPGLRVLDGVTQAVLFETQPYEATFTRGVIVAVGDLTGDGVADLVITPDDGGGPRVRVYNGRTFTQVADFFGVETPAFRGGARAAVGDVNGDGVGDLALAAGFGGGPSVRVLDGRTVGDDPRELLSHSFAHAQPLRGGMYVALGDLNGDGLADLIAGAGPGGGPRVQALDGSRLLRNEPVLVSDFFAGDSDGRGGARVAVKSLDGDGLADLVIGSGGRVIGYPGNGVAGSGSPTPKFDLVAADDSETGALDGVFVG